MNSPAKDRMIITLTIGELETIVEAAVSRALSNGTDPAEKDKLLTPEEAAAIIGVDKKWLYRHAKQLPFARKLSRKAMRFNEQDLGDGW